jgi:hypothetical protein
MKKCEVIDFLKNLTEVKESISKNDEIFTSQQLEQLYFSPVDIDFYIYKNNLLTSLDVTEETFQNNLEFFRLTSMFNYKENPYNSIYPKVKKITKNNIDLYLLENKIDIKKDLTQWIENLKFEIENFPDTNNERLLYREIPISLME